MPSLHDHGAHVTYKDPTTEVVHAIKSDGALFLASVCGEVVAHLGDIYYVHRRVVTCLHCLGDEIPWSASTPKA